MVEKLTTVATRMRRPMGQRSRGENQEPRAMPARKAPSTNEKQRGLPPEA